MLMNKIEIEESSTDKLVTINNNIIQLYDKVNHIIELLSNSNKKEESIGQTSELDENIKISNQKEEFIYSHVIPNLKVGRIIKQEFKYEWKAKQED